MDTERSHSLEEEPSDKSANMHITKPSHSLPQEPDDETTNVDITEPSLNSEQEQLEHKEATNSDAVDLDFIQIDPEIEKQITHIAVHRPVVVIVIMLIIALLTWIAFLIKSLIEGQITYGFCDESVSGYHSCHERNFDKDSRILFLCDYCYDGVAQNNLLFPCWMDTNPGSYASNAGYCTDFNNKSSAISWGRIALCLMSLFWCWKLFKIVHRGIELPSLEKKLDQKRGFKKILSKISALNQKAYDLRINLRGCVSMMTDKCGDSKSNNSDAHSEYDEFAKLMINSGNVLNIMRLLFMDLPIQILNLFSTSLYLQLMAIVEIVIYVQLVMDTYCRSQGVCRCCTSECCSSHKANTLPQYRKLHESFVSRATHLCVLMVVDATLTLSVSYFAVPLSTYDTWLRALNLVKGSYKLLGFVRVIWIVIVFGHYYRQKSGVSVRESLLVKDIWKKQFIWAIFKVKIDDDDKFIIVDKNRATTALIEAMNTDSDHEKEKKGKLCYYFQIVLLLSMNLSLVMSMFGVFVWFSLMYK